MIDDQSHVSSRLLKCYIKKLDSECINEEKKGCRLIANKNTLAAALLGQSRPPVHTVLFAYAVREPEMWTET